MSAEQIRDLVEPALAGAGLELWDVEMHRDVVRILVDRPGGIDLDALATVAGRVVSPLLDEHPEMTPGHRFELEVSSPGLERTLRRPEHFDRYLGAEVSVKTSSPVGGARRHQGTLTGHDGGRISIRADGSLIEIPLDQVERVRTVLVWGPSPKKGAAKRPAAHGLAKAGSPVASQEKDS